MEARLEKIETKLSLAEDLLEELNKTVYRQQRRIDELEHALTAVRGQVQTSMPAETRSPGDEVPPHY
jgi:SlyX protein